MPIEIGEIRAYTLMELTRSLGVTTMTLRKYIKDGKLRARKMAGKWVVTEAALREYLGGEYKQVKEKNN